MSDTKKRILPLRFEQYLHKMANGLFAGAWRSCYPGNGMDFDQVREYQHTDDPRMMDWNVSARMDRPHIKTFSAERDTNLFFLFDVSASMDRGEIRQACATLCGFIGMAAEKNRDRVGGALFSGSISKWLKPSKGPNQVLGLVQMLLQEPKGQAGSSLGSAISAVKRSLGRRGVVIIFSDFKASGWIKPLAALTKKHDVIAVRFADRLENLLPDDGLVTLQDPETHQVLVVPANSQTFRDSFQTILRERHDEWQLACERLGVGMIELYPGDDPALRLTEFFARRMKR